MNTKKKEKKKYSLSIDRIFSRSQHILKLFFSANLIQNMPIIDDHFVNNFLDRFPVEENALDREKK